MLKNSNPSHKNFFFQTTERKVPEIILIFWIIKLFTTAMGESTSDFLVQTIDPVIAVAIGTVGFAVAMILQLVVKKYISWVYWLTVTMVAIFGTMAADVIHIGLGVPYLYSTIFFSITLVIIFSLWYFCEKTLSIHSIFNRRRELFYWSTVLATFALGTAVGDMTATTLGLGYLNSIYLFAVLIAIPAIGWKFFKMNTIVAFWFAYILTRPLGASFADWFGRPSALGGIGIGTGKTSIILGILIIISVLYLVISNPKNKHISKKN
jgi:uncharacterized membrane-anchored protein